MKWGHTKLEIKTKRVESLGKKIPTMTMKRNDL